jgi:hypothetical protein
MITKISKNRGYIKMMFSSKPLRVMSFKFILLKTMYIYTYKQGWKSIHKKYKTCKKNANTWKENQKNQNNSNEMKDVMLKGHPLPQIS